MSLISHYLEVAFGSGYTGLATVGYALKTSAGADVVARTTTGVFEQAGGTYGVVAPVIASSVATVEWDTGGASPVYAHESVAYRLGTMHGIEVGSQEITATGGGTLICYASDGTTVLAQFNLFDIDGARTTGIGNDATRPVASRVAV